MNSTEKRIAGGKGRSDIFMKTGFAGIAVNALLAAAKAVIGWMTGSLAVTLDADVSE